MASNWISIVVLLLSTSWTIVVMSKSLKAFKVSEGNEVSSKDTTSGKSLSLISMPTIPEFPKINARPVLPNLPVGKLPMIQQQEPVTSAASLTADKQPQQVVSLPGNVVVASNGAESEEQVATSSGEKPNMSSEKTQSQSSPASPDVNHNQLDMPLQVLHILNVLGSGGSLAQASKPEKEGNGNGNGHTTANAIGYATGPDANVSALVANTIGVSPQMVTITDTAQASASSSADGTAFSQATLSSNAWLNQFGGWGGGGGWGQQPAGPGWKKE